jgi:hypothetical protein
MYKAKAALYAPRPALVQVLGLLPIGWGKGDHSLPCGTYRTSARNTDSYL